MFGIDISEHQRDRKIDWNQLAKSVDFVALRLAWIGDNQLHYDECFDKFYNEARAHGIPVGVYVFLYCKTEEGAQRGAQWCISKLNGREIQLPFYADMEYYEIAELGREKATSITKAFCDVTEGQGLYTGVYANLNWFTNYLENYIQSRYTCWIAHYTSGNDKYKGLFDVWQNSSKGIVAGISGRVDTDYLYNEKLLICNSTIQPVPIPTPEIPEANIQFDWTGYKNGSTPEPLYEKTTKTKVVGSINPQESVWCYGKRDGMYIVAYYVDGKDYAKSGFVKYHGGVKVPPTPSVVYKNGSTIEKVYRESTLKNEIGYLEPYEECICLDRFKSGNYLVLYKTSNGYKTGFVKYDGGVEN